MLNLMPFVLSLIASLALVALVRKLCYRFGRVAQPRKDRWHSRPTPTLGGVGIFGAFLVTGLVIRGLNGDWRLYQENWSFLVSAGLMFGVGLYDDFKQIKPPIKLIWQLAAATIVIFFGNGRIEFFPWPIANIMLTYFWLIGITNAINLLDNMDGLAGGISLICSGILCYLFWKAEQPELFQITLILAGAILGFLIFNFPPARIFMGDSGSMFLGFLLAELAIARREQASNIFATLGVPTLLMLLPILDTSLVAITRLMRGQSPVQGGRDHTSHRLIAFGLNQRQAVLVLYGVAVISGAAAAGLEALDYNLSLVFIPVLLILLTLFAAYLGRLRVVVDASQVNDHLARLISTLTYKRRIFEILLDLVLIGFSYYLAFWTSFGLNMTNISMGQFLRSWPIALIITYMAFFIFGIYRGVWRYIGINDLIRYLGASVISGAVVWFVTRWFFADIAYGLDIIIFFIVFLLLGLAGSRLSFQVLDRIYSQKITQAVQERVLLYGSGDAGEMALRWILRNPQFGIRVVGFLDDDSMNWGRRIHDVNIYGGVEQLGKMVEEGVNSVIITSDELLNEPNGAKVLQECKERGISVRVMRLEFETVVQGDRYQA
jgi:UDP-GlcNAc:undecaprenyl-phosphate GlcNAc-1-phosphate transferase